MDEEEFYRRQNGMPRRQPTWNPFSYAPVLASSNRKWAKWVARFTLLFFVGLIVVTIIGNLIW